MTVEQLKKWLEDKPDDAVIVIEELDQTSCFTGYYSEAFPVFMTKLNKIRFTDYCD